MKYHLIHHRLVNMVGHRYNEAAGFEEECRRRGYPFRLFISERADPAVRAAFPEARAVLADPVFDMRLTFDQRTEAFAQILHRHLDEEVSADDRVIVTVATQCESLAFTRWLRELPAERRPWVIVFMISDRWNFTNTAERDRQYAEWHAHSLEVQALSPRDRVRMIFAAATGALANDIERQLRAPVEAMPTPIPRHARLRESFRLRWPGTPRQIGLLGGARPEKGSHLIPSIVRSVQARIRAGFIVQLSNETLEGAEFGALEALKGAPGIHTFSAPAEYAHMFERADVLLLPYQAVPYRNRTSGVFLEASIHGKPVIVPGGTWMAEQVKSGRAAGIIFNNLTPDEVADAVVEGLHQYRPLRRSARKLATAWQATEGVAAFVDKVEAEVASRSATGYTAAFLPS